MTSIMKFTSPMGATAIEAAAESLAKQSLALTDLHRSMAAYEAVTGSQIAVVDADAQLVSYGVDLASGPDETVIQRLPQQDQQVMKALRDAVATGTGFTLGGQRIDPAEVFCRNSAAEAQQDAELLDAMFPQPVPPVGIPETGTLAEAEAAGAQAIAELVSETAPTADNPPPVAIADEDEDETRMPACLRNSVQAATDHINSLRYTVKWTRFDDAELVRRALDGENEKAIAAVMEVSPAHIRQRLNMVRDYQHGVGYGHSLDDLHTAFVMLNSNRA